MAATRVSNFVDEGSINSLQTNRNLKQKAASTGLRSSASKTFDSSLQPTPRKPLGDLSNGPKARQPLSNVKNTLHKQQSISQMMKKPPPLSMRTPGGLSVRKGSVGATPAKLQSQKKKMPTIQPELLSVPTPKPVRAIPDIEKMFIFEEPDIPEVLPDELCLSRHLDRLLKKPFPLPQPIRKHKEYPVSDFSNLKFEADLRPIFQDPEPLHNITLAPCLDLPSLDSSDLFDIRKLKIWEDE